MERSRTDKQKPRSQTLPSSPTHSLSSSSSSDFEFTISLSPRKSTSNLIPADQLFYKGQLLPLHLSPRLSMVRTLLLASSSTSSSSDTTTTASRDSTESSNDSHSSFSTDLLLLPDCDSSRPSSVTEDDELKRLNKHDVINQQNKKLGKYFSLSRFSSVFRKEHKTTGNPDNISGSSVKRMSSTAKDMIRKYLKKVKPLYEKISQKQQQQKMGNCRVPTTTIQNSAQSGSAKDGGISIDNGRKQSNATISHSFSGNLRYPRKRSIVTSCPSSMRSSPSHSRSGITLMSKIGGGSSCVDSNSSSMEELQSAIQGAIAHCKNSMIQNNNKSMISKDMIIC